MVTNVRHEWLQVDAIVILWGRLTDRAAMAAVLPTLTFQQLDAVLARLGHYHVLRTIDPPFGCRLSFTIIGNPDQEAAAKLLCKAAVESQQVGTRHAPGSAAPHPVVFAVGAMHLVVISTKTLMHYLWHGCMRAKDPLRGERLQVG